MKDMSKLYFIEVVIGENINPGSDAKCINLSSTKLEGRYIGITPNMIFPNLSFKELKTEFFKIKEKAKELSDKGYTVMQIVSIINSQYASYQ